MVARGMIGDADLRRLTAGRWLVPLMAHVGDEEGSRFAVMLARLGLSRSALAASLAQLQEAGWLARNPGHGHPLRPEYMLTAPARRSPPSPKGDGAARAARARARPAAALVAAAGRAARPDRARFSALRTALRR